MEYRVLGSLEVRDGDRPIPLGGAKQRALLAVLLVNANRVVSRERLIDELWGEEPPETAVTSVQVYVSRLRKLLSPETLLTRPPGYMLSAEPEAVDLQRFERLLAEGRKALARGDAERAARLLRESLDLWRGPALAEFAPEPFAQIEGGRLDDLHVVALEERIEADLALGGHVDLIGELEVLIAAHPHRERLRGQLMLALYRSGRQAEALAVYRNVRATLDELGIEPGVTLQRLEKQVLNHDTEIDAPPARTWAADDAPNLARPAAPPPPLERKRVTVIFAALASTNEAEDDPEQTAALLDRFHDEAAAEIEAAGGTVEKGLVGALLATFAPSAVGEADDASRAISAALATSNRLTRAFGKTLLLRMALESGDVILGRPGAFVMGAPVAAAARLVGLAQPGEVIVGEHAATAAAGAFELQKRGDVHVLAGAPGSGGPAARQTDAPDVRKSVTILFADLVESTRLGRQLDPEALRGLMSRYFEEMQSVVERHGGTVEKFIGDAVMAVFGVPVLHEDDALRGVRAAAEMREALATLNQDLEPTWAIDLKCRIGVSSGEVIAGDHLQGHAFVTGEVVTSAKRLEEAAAASEILISEATHRLVRDAVVTEHVSGRAVKGGETVDALQLLEVLARVPGHARRFDSPLVDREQELSALRSAFASVVQDRSCHLVTVLGAAGVGKSRLVQEFVAQVGADATVLRGHCLPYGEGITYWPLSEVVREIVRTEGSAEAEPSSAAIAQLLPAEEKAVLIAELISEALGLAGTGAGTGEETFWAVRKLFEALAHRRPLVVVFDDLQWAEPTFIELVDYLAGLSRDAPILLLCMARPEVFDSHPGWGGGKLNASSMLLEPLSDGDCRRLITNLLGRGPLPAGVETRIAEAADGNALFAEELLAMLVDDDLLLWKDGRWIVADELLDLPVPQTINSLLAARLDGLPKEARALLVRASVEGTLFHRSALGELAPELSDASLESSLATLVRRDVIRPERSSFAGDEAYRFRHLLIRDAAYRSLSKTTRADLHERFAAWLERTSGERVREYEEIVGYHLEQAYRCRLEIGSAEAELSALGARASQRLESAGRRALARSDLPAAISLLERGSELLASDGPRRAALLAELGAALIEAGTKKQVAKAELILAEARQLAAAAHDECADSHALVQQQLLQVLRAEDGAMEEATRAVKRVVPVFERCGDQHGLCRARRLEAMLYWNAARAAEAAEAWEEAATHARRAGDEDERSEILSWVASSLFFGPTPVPEAISRCEEIRVAVSANPGSEAWTLRSLAGLHAMHGSFELAREFLAAGNAIFEELGQTRNSSVADIDGIVEILAGDLAAAERRLYAGYLALEEMEDRAFRPTTAAHLAQVMYAQGRNDEATRFTHISEELAASDDLLTQVTWRSVRARILAGQGRMDEADELALEAVAISESTDFLNTRAGALIDLAQIRHEAGRIEDANAAVAGGLALYERKGNRVAARKTREQFAVLL